MTVQGEMEVYALLPLIVVWVLMCVCCVWGVSMCEDMSMCKHVCVGVRACVCVLCVGRRESSKELP